MLRGSGRRIRLHPFAFRQFEDASYAGTRVVGMSKAEFEEKVNHHYDHKEAESETTCLAEGYAPFCKHLFIPNFTGATVGSLRITPENEHLLRSDYVARREGELPVLTRWFPHDKVTLPTAAFLDIILYSKEQIDKEDAAMGSNESSSLSNQDYQWGIVSIKAQNEEFESPMAPITMMRNALGVKDGGSGVALDRDAYARSVAYWKEHANVL
ncbi:Flagellar associated protein [Balamuthia mandrillaris]